MCIYMYEQRVVVYYSILAPHFPFVSLGHECEFRKYTKYVTISFQKITILNSDIQPLFGP